MYVLYFYKPVLKVPKKFSSIQIILVNVKKKSYSNSNKYSLNKIFQ